MRLKETGVGAPFVPCSKPRMQYEDTDSTRITACSSTTELGREGNPGRSHGSTEHGAHGAPQTSVGTGSGAGTHRPHTGSIRPRASTTCMAPPCEQDCLE